jgi:hypothetical protein
MAAIWWMRKFIFLVFDIVAESTSELDMVVDASDESDTKLIWKG